MALQGCRVLVIRPRLLPEWGADQFVEQLAAAGAEPFHYPVMAIRPFTIAQTGNVESPECQSITSRVISLANYSAAVFVSRVAAHLGAGWIDCYWPQLPVTTRFYAVGGSTAQVLDDKGISAVAPGADMTSEGLLALPELQQLDDQKVLIFRGCGGRELLAETLRQRGAQVHYAELYRREVIADYQQQIRASLRAGIDAVAVHSGEALDALQQLLPTSLHRVLKNSPLLVPGQRLASLARDAGFQQIAVSPNALPQSMVSTLGRWYINRNR